MTKKIMLLFSFCVLAFGLTGCFFVGEEDYMYSSYSPYSPYPTGSYEWAMDYYHRPPAYYHHYHAGSHVHKKPDHHKHDHYKPNHDPKHDPKHDKPKQDKPKHDKPQNPPKHHDTPKDAPKHHDTPKHNVNPKTPAHDFSNHSAHQSHQMKVEKPKAEFKGPRTHLGRR